MSSTNRIEMLSARSAALSSENPARARLSKLFDADSFVELDAFVKAGENEAGVVAGYGLVEGSVVYAFSQDVSSDSGAVSAAHAKKVKKVYELAAKTGCPVVCIYDSKGAKLSEGNEMLAAYSDMLASSGKISGVVPQIAVVLGTCAGVSAMLAAAADVLVISRDAQLFMTAPFISAANGDKSENAGSAEAAAKAGVASIVADDENAALAKVRTLLTMLPQNNLASLPLFDFTDSTEPLDPAGCPKLIVKAVADADSLVELHAEYGKGVPFEASSTPIGTGDGVLLVADRASYIPYCLENNGTTLFSFGLRLSEEQRAAVHTAVSEIKERLIAWDPPLQTARRQNPAADAKAYPDFASRLCNETGARFYKFKRGRFKRYFVMSTNCVLLVDSIIGGDRYFKFERNGIAGDALRLSGI